VRREITITQVTSWLLALVAGGSSLSFGLLLFFQDREWHALLFALGGVALTVWTSTHLTDRR
jgi:hypothetical protein